MAIGGDSCPKPNAQQTGLAFCQGGGGRWEGRSGFFLGDFGKQGAGRKRELVTRGPLSRVSSRRNPPTPKVPGRPWPGTAWPHWAPEPSTSFASQALGGSPFLRCTTFSGTGGCQMQSPELACELAGAPSARPSRLFHPAVKPEVKYLLNDAIRPVAHYGVYLAINYGLARGR